MSILGQIRDSILHMIYPINCAGCGADLTSAGSSLCLKCIFELPKTGFHLHGNNPVEKIFWGRLPVTSAMSLYYFTRQSILQQLVHNIKYRGEQDLAIQLGHLIGQALKETNRFNGIDVIIPLPLYASREKKRGYNQAALLASGISEQLGIPVLNRAVIRTEATSTQTHKNRLERWENMEGKFYCQQPDLLKGLHMLLVDDIITTGATLEACGTALLKPADTRLSIATLAFASK